LKKWTQNSDRCVREYDTRLSIFNLLTRKSREPFVYEPCFVVTATLSTERVLLACHRTATVIPGKLLRSAQLSRLVLFGCECGEFY